MLVWKKLFFASLCLLFINSENLLAASSDQQAVAQREEEWRQAWVDGNVNLLEDLHGNDYFAINNQGHFTTRDQVLSDVRSGKFKYTRMEHKNRVIRIYHNTAIVNGLTLNQGYRGERDVSGTFAYTRVYIKENNIWRAVLAQYTRPADQNRAG